MINSKSPPGKRKIFKNNTIGFLTLRTQTILTKHYGLVQTTERRDPDRHQK